MKHFVNQCVNRRSNTSACIIVIHMQEYTSVCTICGAYLRIGVRALYEVYLGIVLCNYRTTVGTVRVHHY